MSEPSNLIRGATNEYVLLVFRAGSSLLLLTITGLVGFLVTDAAKTRDALNAFIVATSVSLAETRGKVDVLTGRYDAQSARISGLETDQRAIWGRLYDITGSRSGGPSQKAVP